mgnify:CR=1 FL=1
MSCYTIIGANNKSESLLYKDLVSKHGEDRANYLYEVVSQDSASKHSFNNWWQRESEPLVNDKGEPVSEMVDKWLSYLERVNKLQKSFHTNDFQLSMEEFNDLSEGLTYYMVNSIFKDKPGISIDTFTSLEYRDVRNILNTSLNKVFKDLNDNIENFEEEDVDRVKSIIKNISSDKKGFYKAFNNYLKDKLNFEINVEAILSDEIETAEDKNTKDSAFSKNAIEFDVKASASPSIKILIASLPKLEKDGYIELNALGLPSLVDYNATFNFIQHKLMDIPGDVELMTLELQKYLNIKPELKYFIDKINFGKDEYSFPEDVKQMFM